MDNSPETPLYKKSALLYGIHLAAPVISEVGQAVIVEGYTDAIAAHQAGLTNTVATGGTALTEPASPFDGDEAGLQAAQRVAELPRETLQGLNLQVAQIPTGSDLASLVAAGKTELLRQAVGTPTPLVHHLIDMILSHHNLEEPEFPGTSPALRRSACDPPHRPSREGTGHQLPRRASGTKRRHDRIRP